MYVKIFQLILIKAYSTNKYGQICSEVFKNFLLLYNIILVYNIMLLSGMLHCDLTFIYILKGSPW